MLTSTDYWQEVKLAFNASLVVTPNNVICTRLSSQLKPISLQLWAQYSQTGDNLNVIAYLQRGAGRPIKAGSCSLTLAELSGDGTWSEINSDSVVATEDSLSQWVAIIPASDVITNPCEGKSTVKITAVMQRAAQTFKKEIYLNHLGIGEAAAWLRNRMNYVETTKKDD